MVTCRLEMVQEVGRGMDQALFGKGSNAAMDRQLVVDYWFWYGM